jgi:hypothetical protein
MCESYIVRFLDLVVAALLLRSKFISMGWSAIPRLRIRLRRITPLGMTMRLRLPPRRITSLGMTMLDYVSALGGLLRHAMTSAGRPSASKPSADKLENDELSYS